MCLSSRVAQASYCFKSPVILSKQFFAHALSFKSGTRIFVIQITSEFSPGFDALKLSDKTASFFTAKFVSKLFHHFVIIT